MRSSFDIDMQQIQDSLLGAISEVQDIPDEDFSENRDEVVGCLYAVRLSLESLKKRYAESIQED